MDYSAAILESLSEGIIAFDGARRAVMANPSLISMMGWTGRAVTGETVDALIGSRPDLLRLVEDRYSGTEGAPADLVQRRSDGSVQHLRVTTSALPSDEGRGVIMVVRDVSEPKRVEWEILQVEKMSALGRLAASVAHEVRNPLGAIDIQLQLLLEDFLEAPTELREGLSRRLSVAQAEMKRLDRIVRNFLRFSRTPRLHLEKVSLNDIVSHVFELVSPEAREQGVSLNLALCTDLPPVDGDEDLLGQAILNMAINAFQSMDEGGKLSAETWVDLAPGQVCLGLADTGCGIPASEIDRVFEYYHTTKDGGTGLGLSIAQQIIYQHGGHIEVESAAGAGTTFRIHLPISPKQEG